MLNPHLTRQEIEEFHRNGYAGPFTICAPAEAEAFNDRVEREVLARPGPWPGHPQQLRHQDSRMVYDLVAHPEILGRVASLFGSDIMLWRTNMFEKRPGGQAVPWHQDAYFWRLNPPLNLTAWIALDAVDAENGCVQIIPGSHLKVVRHISSGPREYDPDSQFDEMADPAVFDQSRAVKMELQPGQFFLFNERVLHASDPNRTDRRRRCMVSRYSAPFVRIPPLCDGHRMIMASGVDKFGFNLFVDSPEA